MTAARRVPVVGWTRGERSAREDEVAAEVPVALTYNKRPAVVMMVTPDALDDFAIGFSLSEGLIDSPSDILESSVLKRDKGLELALTVGQESIDRLSRQRRNLTGRTGCGLCGMESLDQAISRPGPVGSRVAVRSAALQAAVASLDEHQPLQLRTGAVHGAAWCDTSGAIRVLREDVGRHNALDKLIGCLAREDFDPGTGFALVSSRASYEMVHKSAVVGIEVLASVSAPTALAIDIANQCGMTLVGFTRPGRHNIYSFERRILED